MPCSQVTTTFSIRRLINHLMPDQKKAPPNAKHDLSWWMRCVCDFTGPRACESCLTHTFSAVYTLMAVIVLTSRPRPVCAPLRVLTAHSDRASFSLRSINTPSSHVLASNGTDLTSSSHLFQRIEASRNAPTTGGSSGRDSRRGHPDQTVHHCRPVRMDRGQSGPAAGRRSRHGHLSGEDKRAHDVLASDLASAVPQSLQCAQRPTNAMTGLDLCPNSSSHCCTL